MDALVSWDTPTDGSVTEHHVFRGYAPGEYFDSRVVLMPTVQFQFTGLDDFKRHYFAVTAFNGLESDFSTVVSKRVAHRFTLKGG